jgi:hypothetical protein
LGFSRRRGCRRRRRPRRRGWGRGACRARRRVARPRRAGMRWRRLGKRRGLGGRLQSKQLPWWCDVTLVEGDATGSGFGPPQHASPSQCAPAHGPILLL